MSSQGRVRPDPDVVDTDIDDGEVALLHLGTKTYFSLNVTGARIWRQSSTAMGTGITKEPKAN